MSAPEHGVVPKPSAVEEDDPDALMTAVVGIAGFALLFVIIVFLQGLFERTSWNEFERKVVEETPQELQALRASQLEQLGGYRIVDPAAGTVALPIERAMELVIQERKASTTSNP